VDEEEYAAAVDVENRNRQIGEDVEARSVDAAIGALTLGSDESVDRHPEK
jgi:hypothetical protein